MSTTCNSANCSGRYLFGQNTRCCEPCVDDCNGTVTTTVASPTTAGIIKTDCASTDPVAVTGWFFRNTLVDLQVIPSDLCNKIAVLTGRLVDGDITAKLYRWVNTDLTGEDLVTLSVIVALDNGGKWVQI